MASDAVYYDGRAATSRMVNLREEGHLIVISGPQMVDRAWPLRGMHPIKAPLPGQPWAITHRNFPSQRLLVRDAALVARLQAQINGSSGEHLPASARTVLGRVAAGILVMAGVTYLAMAVLPQPIAHLLPQSWRSTTGANLESELAHGYRLCSSPRAEHAIGQLLANLAEGTPDMPPISVHVYELPVVNAFAVNGGHIIVTSKLIQQMQAPEELAGVLAHEIGHVAHRHPEAQTVRVAGLEILAGLMSGKGNGGLANNVALLAAVLRQSRAAESEADAYAQDMLDNAAIDPEGLRTFFIKLKKIEDALLPPGSFLHGLGTMTSDHPGTEDRLKRIRPLPAGVTAKPALGAEDWAALKKICG